MAEFGVFHEYAGGVDMGLGSHVSRKSVHGLVVVGGGREDGQEYWLLRNLFGIHWAEGGHYKLNKRGKCMINENGLAISFSSVSSI